MRRLALITASIIAALILVIGVGFFLVKGSGSGAIEGWIGSELQLIANSYLNPKLSFSDLDYTYPGTVSLKKLRLTSDDPGGGKSIDILGCDQATLTLAEVPQVGKPLVIEKIVFDKPLFSAVAMGAGSRKLIGFSDLVGGEKSAATQPAVLSDVFRMRLVQINDGRIVYDPRAEGAEVMELDRINTVLNIDPVETGWYKLALALKRQPLFDLSLAGQLNLDTFTARDLAIKLRTELSPENYASLPPQMQKLLRKYEVTGTLGCTVFGTLPIMQPARGELAADFKLVGGNITLGEYRVPVKELEVAARLEEGKLHLPSVKVEALKGTADLSGWAVLEGQVDSQLKLKVAGMMLEDLLARRTEGEPSKLAGKVNAEMEITAPARVLSAALAGKPQGALPDKWGWGKVNLTEASLVQISSIRKISDGLLAATKLVRPSTSEGKPSERMDLSFDLTRDRAEFTEFTYVGQVLAGRGKGWISLDQKLDLTLNAGPVEKVQQLLGENVGGALAFITDKLVGYRVTGTMKEPKVSVEFGGGALGNIGQ